MFEYMYKHNGLFSLFICIVRLSCDLTQAAVLCSEVPGLPQQSAGGCEECWQCGDQGRAGKEGGRHQPLSFHLSLSLSLSLSQAKLRSVALKITANINVLIRVSGLVPFQFLHSFILPIPHSRTSSTTPHPTRRR